MRRFFAKLLLGAIALSAPLLAANTASAAQCAWLGYGASGSLDCKVVVTGGCDTECQPLNFTAQCGYTCKDKCTVDVETSCSTTCEDSCKTSCKPSELDCVGYCQTDCEASCSTYCSKHGDVEDCQEKCQGNCQSDCGVSCQVKPPSCTTMCQEACHGSCHTQANLDCELSCEGGCTAKLTGGCNTQCSTPTGALFCNGQYVDVSAVDVVECETAFVLDANVDCEGDTCTATVTAGGCAMASPANAPLDFAALGAMAGGIGLIVSRRRNKKKN